MRSRLKSGDNCALDEECIDSDCETIDGECYGVCTVPPDPAACGNETCDLTTEYCGMQGPNNMTCRTKKPDGQACEADEECEDGSGCMEGAAGTGTCTALNSLAADAPCGSTEFCQPDYVCAGQQVSTCQEVTFGSDGETCGSSAACEPGLVCQDFGFTGGTCGAARANGEECQFNFQCQIGLYCDGFSFQNGTPGTCLPRLADGETCDEDDDCEAQFCDIPDGQDEGTCGAVTYCAVP